MTDGLSPPEVGEDVASAIEDLLDDLRSLIVLLERHEAIRERAKQAGQLSVQAKTSFNELEAIASRLDAVDAAQSAQLSEAEAVQAARGRATRDIIIETIESWRQAPDSQPSRH